MTHDDDAANHDDNDDDDDCSGRHTNEEYEVVEDDNDDVVCVFVYLGNHVHHWHMQQQKREIMIKKFHLKATLSVCTCNAKVYFWKMHSCCKTITNSHPPR